MSVSRSAPVVIDIREDAAPSLESPGLQNRQRRGRPTWFGVAYIVLLVVSVATRLWDLDTQALHHDESLHAVYSWYLYDGRGYQHNPMMHGPFQFFGTAGVFALLGDNATTARLLPALFGSLLVLAPLLLRSYLGRAGALATSLLLAFSPTMLYYSRFARNDIYMAVWTLALVALMWRYIHTRRARYLLGSSALLALAFATKETSYLLVAILGSFLIVYAAGDVVPWLFGRKSLRDFSPKGDYLVLLGTLSLPLGAASIALVEDLLGLTLANPDWKVGPIGIPMGSGLYVAFFFSVVLIIAAFAVGLRWRPKLWLACFSVFFLVWALLYTSFFTNVWAGLGSGMWQSLGYWLAQQDVARGGQPWYYYLIIGFTYEYVAMAVGGVAMVVFALKGNAFSRFLAFWAFATLLSYTYASEKMPWLLVGVSLPLIVLAGRAIGSMLEKGPWILRARQDEEENGGLCRPTAIDWRTVAFSVLVVLFLAAAGWSLVEAVTVDGSLIVLVVLLLAVVASASGIVYLSAWIRRDRRWVLIGLSAVAVLFVFSVPSAFRAAYANADVPVELLVYTQSAPDIPQIANDIERLGDETGKGRNLEVLVDSTDGFSWPWVWYLRDYAFAVYRCLGEDEGCSTLSEPPDADVVLVAAKNNDDVKPKMGSFGEPVRYKHRWWFPESYRGLTPAKVWDGLRSREAWCNVVAYFVERDFGQRIGSIDSYAYFPDGFDPAPAGAEADTGGLRCP